MADNIPGTLFVVATPIGNLSEMTERAVETLNNVDFIAAEDTRVSAVLLNRFGIKKKIISCHKFNEARRAEEMIEEILNGKNAALISDAGTPCISDPGYIAVKLAVSAGIQVVGVSGPCAAVLALSVSGFDTAAFSFYGFLQRSKSKATGTLEQIQNDAPDVAVLYESPMRITDTVKLLGEAFPDAELCVCNDLTKKFERIYRGNPAEILAELNENPSAGKGEYTIVVKKNYEKAEIPHDEEISIEARLVDIMIRRNCSLKEAVSSLHADCKGNLPKKSIYAASLRLKNMKDFHFQ